MSKCTTRRQATALMVVLLIAAGVTGMRARTHAAVADASVPPVLAFTMPSLSRRMIPLSHYLGKVILIVNTASKCGFTPQYAGLEKLYKQFKAKGFEILGFPSNDFGHQEPGTNKQISLFCTSHYGVTFPMFSKVDVKGPHQCELYHYLTGNKTDSKYAGVVKWNFEKFLISRNGKIVARFRSHITPESLQITHAIEQQLAK